MPPNGIDSRFVPWPFNTGWKQKGWQRNSTTTPARGRELLRLHHATYPTYWRWSDAIRDYAILRGELQAAFGWTVHVGENVNPRSLRNFPLQGNGGEMLRLGLLLRYGAGNPGLLSGPRRPAD